LTWVCTGVEQVTSDVLGMMMSAQDPDSGQGLSDEELRDHVKTLMLAGHEVSQQSWMRSSRLIDISL